MLMDTNTMIRNKAKSFKLIKDDTISIDFRKALELFMNNEVKKVGNYVSTKNALVYRTLSTVDGFNQDVILIRLVRDGQVHYLGNSSRLQYVDTHVAFGNRTRNWGETRVQRYLNTIGIPMLPFDSFIQAGLKITETEILEQTGAENVKRNVGTTKKPKFEDVHFTGASLFQNGSKTFLFDIDREEIKHKIFNPFIVEIPKKVSTIKEAYDALIPMEVRTAMVEGKKVIRQGEHFFIKMSEINKYKADKATDSWISEQNDGFAQARLSAQGNRDHIASRYNAKKGLVSGFVEHTGREHKDLDLTNGWYKPVPNTAVRSFTITGDVD